MWVSLLAFTLAYAIYEEDTPVELLTKANFDQDVLRSPSPWIVEFYAPWCGHCKALKDDWETLARGMGSVVRVGAVDATEQGEIAGSYGIHGYPSILFFGQDKASPKRYESAREAADIAKFCIDEVEYMVHRRLQVKAPNKKKMSKAVSFMADDDDDSDGAPVKKAPVVARPPVAQPVPVAEPVRESLASSRASENIRETVPTPPAPPKQESPKEEKKKSIAELAALINPAALGGGPRPGSRAPPQVTRTTNVNRQTETAGGVTFDGQMDHNNFAAKPTTAVQKKVATKKNVFFSDSDESDEQDSKPQAPVAAARPAPVQVQQPVAPVQQQPPAPQSPAPRSQVDESTRHQWGDGQWYEDASGAYFYYDETGNKNYYQGEDYGDEDGGYGQSYAQDYFAQQTRGDEGRGSIMPQGGNRLSMARPTTSPMGSSNRDSVSRGSVMPQKRPSIPSQPSSASKISSSASPMKSVPEEPVQQQTAPKAGASVMN